MSGAHLGDRLSVFLDGELGPADRAAAEAHLRECADCAHELEELLAVDALARETPVPAPDGYFEALPGRVRQRIRARRRLRPAVWTAAAAAAAVVLVSVIAPLTVRRAPAIGPSVAPAESGAAPAAPPPPATTAPAAADRPMAESAEMAARQERAATPPREARLKERTRNALPAQAQAQAPAPGRYAAAVSPSADLREPDAETKAEVAEREDAFAAPPPAAMAKVAPAAPAVSERKLAGAGLAHPDRALMDDQRYRALDARRPTSAAEARALRDAWDLYARDRPGDARADEARVHAIESAIAAWRLGGDPADLSVARRKASAYLAAENAPQRARVRALADGLPASR